MFNSTTLVAISLFLGTLQLAGCGSGPAGRVDERDLKAMPADAAWECPTAQAQQVRQAMLEQSRILLGDSARPAQALDQMLSDAGRRIAQLPGTGRPTLLVSAIRNEIGNLKYDSAPETICANLLRNERIRQRFNVVSEREPVEVVLAGVGEPDAGEMVYQVSGQLSHNLDLDARRLQVQLMLTIDREGTRAATIEQAVEYRFHPYRLEWIPASEDDALRARFLASIGVHGAE